MTHKFRSSAFTLIELLVVIAIIAILAAILFPVFARARENARRSSCQSNLKQVALGFKQYIQDYDEKYPLANAGSTNATGWAIQIQPYLKSSQIFQCPSEPTAPFNTDPTNANYGNSGYSDYYYNYNLRNGPNEASLDFISNTILNGDGPSTDAASTRSADPLNTVSTARHLEGNNYSYTDGHVKWLRFGKVLGGDQSNAGQCGQPSGTSAASSSVSTFCY